MAITNYVQLQTAVLSFMERTDISGNVTDFISLAEATFNRELRVVETDVVLTGIIGSRAIDISALNMIEPVALFLIDTPLEVELTPRHDGSFPYSSINSRPMIWAIDTDKINFDAPLDKAYQFRFRFNGKFALSAAAPTNKLLTDHPDVYLAGTIMWGGLFTGDDTTTDRYASLLQAFMSAAKHKLANNRKGKMMVDPMLLTGARMVPW